VKVGSCGIFVSKKYPFLGASPDGVISDKLICEMKCHYSAKNKNISPFTVPGWWMERWLSVEHINITTKYKDSCFVPRAVFVTLSFTPSQTSNV